MKKSTPCGQTAATKLQSEFSSFFSIILLVALFAALTVGCGSGSGSNGQNNPLDSTAGDQIDQDVSPDENPVPDPECGGVDNLECEAGFICVDDESDNCFPDAGDLDCAGVCVEEPPPDQIEVVCGLDGDPACLEGQTCADVEDDCDPLNGGIDCPTECVDSSPSGDQTQNYIIGDACAGWDGLGCIAPFTCIDDPADDCDLATDDTCPGICVLWQVE